jgi:hypothetical protein
MMKKSLLLLAISLSFISAEEVPSQETLQTQQREGWTVRVDERLLKGEHMEDGSKALKLLDAKLVAITAVVPAKALAELRKVTIQINYDYGKLSPMQYHPEAQWLKENGYSEQLARCVHIPQASDILSPEENQRMSYVVLHELAHAYHDQVLGFEEPRILAAWKKFCASGKYKSVLTSNGAMREHYGLTDQKEFFAEMTEAYFGYNDFYPFVAGELKQAEPEIFALMTDIWGKI